MKGFEKGFKKGFKKGRFGFNQEIKNNKRK
jgi:hypothetical protein